MLLIIAGPILAATAVSVLSMTQPLGGDHSEDILLAFGPVQDCVTISVLALSLSVTALCLAIRHRYSY